MIIHVSFTGNLPDFMGENHGFLQNGAPKIAKLRCKVAVFFVYVRYIYIYIYIYI